MKHNFNTMQALLEFRRAYKENLMHPSKCKSLSETRKCIDYLHLLMRELKNQYGSVPDEAHDLFEKYTQIQEKLIFDNFQKEYE